MISINLAGRNAGRDNQTCLPRPNSQARAGTGKDVFPVFPVQLTISRIRQPDE